MIQFELGICVTQIKISDILARACYSDVTFVWLSHQSQTVLHVFDDAIAWVCRSDISYTGANMLE